MDRHSAEFQHESGFGRSSPMCEERSQLARGMVRNLWQGLRSLSLRSRPVRPYRYDRRISVMPIQPGPYLAR